MFIPFLSSLHLAGTAFMEFYRGIDNSGFLDLCSAVISVVAYILASRALYTLAKDREIPNPWLAWVPIGCNWILGYLSDQYQGRVHKKIKTKRIFLLVLELAVLVCTAVFAIPILTAEEEGIALLAIILVYTRDFFLPVILVLAIPNAVVLYMALYDVYRSCDPDHATLYLVLSMFIGLAQAICLFICREKHDGMEPPLPGDYDEPWQEPKSPPCDPFQIP